MDKAVYVEIQTQLETTVSFVRMFDLDLLDEFIRTAEKADTMGPYVDPTLWIANRDKLQMVIRHARALYRFAKDVAS